MKKDLLLIVVTVFVLALLISGVKIQSTEEYYNEHLDDITEGSATVYVSIDCGCALNQYESLPDNVRKNLPYDGVILPELQVKLRDGDTVYSVLSRVAKVYRIQLDVAFSEYGDHVYVKGVNNLYERDVGDLSGWRYSVNGDYPRESCGEFRLSDGDVIKWIYECGSGSDSAFFFGGAK